MFSDFLVRRSFGNTTESLSETIVPSLPGVKETEKKEDDRPDLD
jgi:hypothetical protein